MRNIATWRIAGRAHSWSLAVLARMLRCLIPSVLFVHIMVTLRASWVPAQSVRSPESCKSNSKPFLAFSKSQEKSIEVFRFDQRLDGHSPIFKTWRVNRKNVGAIRENRSSIV